MSDKKKLTIAEEALYNYNRFIAERKKAINKQELAEKREFDILTGKILTNNILYDIIMEASKQGKRSVKIEYDDFINMFETDYFTKVQFIHANILAIEDIIVRYLTKQGCTCSFYDQRNIDLKDYEYTHDEYFTYRFFIVTW